MKLAVQFCTKVPWVLKTVSFIFMCPTFFVYYIICQSLSGSENVTFAFLDRTRRKTIIPIAMALRNNTVTTARPAASAGWLDNEVKNDAFDWQNPPLHACSSKFDPGHSAPPLAGTGFVHVRSCVWRHSVLHWDHWCQLDQPPAMAHSFLQSSSSVDFPLQGSPNLDGGGVSHFRWRSRRFFEQEFLGHFDHSVQRLQRPFTETVTAAGLEVRLPTRFSARHLYSPKSCKW